MASTPTSLEVAGPRTVWDPFQGTRPFEQAAVPEPPKGVTVPGWIRTAFGLGTIAGAILIVGVLVSPMAGWIGAGVLAVSVLGLLGADLLSKGAERRDFRLWQVAVRNGWAFRLVARPVDSRIGGRRVRTVDPLAAQATAAIPELLRSRPGQLIPLRFMAMYWGTTADGVPFWLGLQEYEADATLGAGALKRDAFANRATRGKLYMLAAAFHLSRDTGIRARLLAEPLPTEGWRDLRTESIEFNRAFAITIADDRTGDGGELALRRALSPATQTTLIDLHRRYRVQLVIDGSIVFMTGQDRIMSEDDRVVAGHLDALVRGFAEGAVAVKPYVE